MDDPRRGGGRQTVGVDMGHHVMADFLFPLLCGSVVDVGDVGFQLRHLLCGDGQTQLVLRPGQLHPQPPPGLEPHVRGKQVQHVFRRIPGSQGGFVNVLAHKSPSFTFEDSIQFILQKSSGNVQAKELERRRRSSSFSFYRMMRLSRSAPTDT